MSGSGTPCANTSELNRFCSSSAQGRTPSLGHDPRRATGIVDTGASRLGMLRTHSSGSFLADLVRSHSTNAIGRKPKPISEIVAPIVRMALPTRWITEFRSTAPSSGSTGLATSYLPARSATAASTRGTTANIWARPRPDRAHRELHGEPGLRPARGQRTGQSCS